MPTRISQKLRRLRDEGEVTKAEYAELLRLARSKTKMTRKQKQTAMRNLRRGCKKICSPNKRESKTEKQVKKLRSEINETVRQERLKIELKELRQKRREIREAKRALRNSDFSIL